MTTFDHHNVLGHAIECLFEMIEIDTSPCNINSAFFDPQRGDFTPPVARIFDCISAKLMENIEIVRNEDNSPIGLFGKIVDGVRGNILLSGHVDVVNSVENTWEVTKPYIPLRKDECIYGRGAADMKGFIACVLSVADYWKSKGIYQFESNLVSLTHLIPSRVYGIFSVSARFRSFFYFDRFILT
jgi:acetylornithine deacetylase/succinyl-diaminopimelate desuccinylase-like protein